MPFHLTGEPHRIHAVLCWGCNRLRPFDTEKHARRVLNDMIITGSVVDDRTVAECACEGLCDCD